MRKNVVIGIISIVIIVSFFSGCTSEDETTSSIVTPNILFKQENYSHLLAVASVDSSKILWNDLDIKGFCDTSKLGTYIIVGDEILGCKGNITIRYVPTNTLMGEWTFV